MKIVATVNGPGEAAGWLRPIADAVACRPAADLSITAVVTPCQLSSGRETLVVSRFSGVAHVERLAPYLRHQLMGRRRSDRPALVLHLGGDPVYALLLARVLGAAVWTYGTSARYRRAFHRFLVPDERTARKLRERSVAADRIAVVGQLVNDSVLNGQRAAPLGSAESPAVAFLPGSREAQVRFLVPYYAAVAELAAAETPHIRWLMVASRFVAADVFASAFGAAGWTMESREGAVHAVSARGARIEVIDGGLEVLGGADLAVTIPGTNTLQLAALGLPHVVIAPCHHAELIAFPGLFGLLNPSWWGAARIRRAVLARVSQRLPHLAIPNIIAGESIVPELRGPHWRGDVEPADVAAEVLSLLADPARRRTMAERLKTVAGPPGAAARLVEMIDDWRKYTCASAS